MTDPLDAIEWPAPTLALNAEARREAIRRVLPELSDDDLELVAARSRKVRVPATQAPSRLAATVRALRDVTKGAIIRAEAIDRADGAQKKRLVTDEVMRALEAIEARLDVMPGWIQKPAFWLIRKGIDRMVESVFRWLHEEGVINGGRALP